eukprot:c1015_g1_i1.p1 GENE.c1015_g1_i1~~c1015_g1_i1.p1  ORF type:complete len:145 (-),score=54.10 c1015_g1_i1:3-383(-)
MIHGYLSQRLIGVCGRTARLTLIARRSWRFAGTRFLKRGLNCEGYVANDVEVEQLLCGDFSMKPNSLQGITSFVQMRGSVPLFWGQDTSVLDPKPEIEIHHFDPLYTATLLHFHQMVRRYGKPLIA